MLSEFEGAAILGLGSLPPNIVEVMIAATVIAVNEQTSPYVR
jgi:hypothetical protein